MPGRTEVGQAPLLPAGPAVIEVDFGRSFPAAYDVEILDLAPEGVRVFGRSDSSCSGDVTLAVGTGGRRWVATARAGEPGLRGAITGVYSTPNPSKVCVVARGDAYVIDTAAPDSFDSIDTAGPVMEVRPLVESDLLLLVGPWTITGLGRDGVRWRTRRLAIEGIRLDELQDGWLAGVADPNDDEARDFSVDLRSGRHEGGVPFA